MAEYYAQRANPATGAGLIITEATAISHFLWRNCCWLHRLSKSLSPPLVRQPAVQWARMLTQTNWRGRERHNLTEQLFIHRAGHMFASQWVGVLLKRVV